MSNASFRRSWPRFQGTRKQRGQALVYGLFVLTGGLVALFFLFNAGQLSSEKTKLVNTADAVAYSAGVMHARALNFDAYTNRAMMANDVMVAQLVSLGSWLQYAQAHVARVPAMACYTYYAVPVVQVLTEYIPLCFALSYPPGPQVIDYANDAFQQAGPVAMAASDAAKAISQTAQSLMHAQFVPARKSLLQQVADANYRNDGTVKVDPIPLTDNYLSFDGAPFIRPYAGDDRQRIKDATLAAAHSDEFVSNRSWNSHSPWGCNPIIARGDATKTGGTQMNGFDEWKATDSARHRAEMVSWSFWSGWRCRGSNYSLGSGNQVATKDDGSGGMSSDDWNYSGLPTFYELSGKALGYTPENQDAGKRDPRLRFAVRLTRDKAQEKTSAGRSQIKPQGSLNIYQGSEARDMLAAVATSEVFFQRPQGRLDRRKELASLFNPYWQVRLVGNSDADVAAAIAMQTLGGTP